MGWLEDLFGGGTLGGGVDEDELDPNDTFPSGAEAAAEARAKEQWADTDKDGVDVADSLAKLNPAPPVLFISGVKTDRVLPGPVLYKPFGPMAFLEKVGRMLSSVPHQ